MRAEPELWFRRGPNSAIPILLHQLKIRELTASPRLGARDALHKKGYVPGDIATIRIYDEANVEVLTGLVRITKIVSKPLVEFTRDDLQGTVVYTNWQMIQCDLAYFTQRAIDQDEIVSLVHFELIEYQDRGFDHLEAGNLVHQIGEIRH